VAVILGAALVPAAAAAQGGPRVLRVDATTGVPRVLAAGAPWTTLGGLAFGSTGTLYVANQGRPGPRPRGAGIYALTAPGFAITPLATTAPTARPAAVVTSGSALYSLDAESVLSIDTAAPFGQRVVSSGGLYDQHGVDPQFGAFVGGTLYTTASAPCVSGKGGAYVIAVDTASGAQSLTRRFGCAGLGGIAATPTGTLLVGQAGRRARIAELDPATGAVTTLSSGGSLELPQGIALDAAGDVLVADTVSGVVAISRDDGEQSPITARGAVNEAAGIAVGADGGIYVTDAGVPPRLRASTARRQRFRRSGVAFTAACDRRCIVGYAVTVRFPRGRPYTDAGAFQNVRARRTLRVRLPRRVNRRIARTLRQGGTVAVRLNLSAGDARTGVAGRRTTLRLRLARAADGGQ
jgi:hypothetical protein